LNSLGRLFRAVPAWLGGIVLFLSYGRGDDEAFVKRLYRRLTLEGFDVWWDRVRMPSRSLTFLKEIREAVHAAERVLVVIGPSCVASDYCRAEWQAGLAATKIVNPVLRLGNHEQLPPELAGLHCPNLSDDARFEDGLAEILRILAEPAPPLGALHGGVPDVPAHFQPRPALTSALASTLLRDDHAPVVLRGPERVTVLHGMGGVGKSVLAAAFARATTTRRSFGDGVFWLGAGRASGEALCERLARLIGVVSEPGSDVATQLSATLAPLGALVVVDDVWQVDQVADVVDALGPACRLLITSRVGEVAAALGAPSVPLDVLSEPEALRHLADWAAVTPEELPVEAVAVATACGRLPFALALNGAMHARGIGWPHLLGALRDAELEYAEQRFKGYPYPTVLASLKVSVDALDSEDDGAGQRLRELVAFHRDGGIPEAAVHRLWAHTAVLTPRHAAKVLATLAGRALIRVDGRRRILVHDLQFDYLKRLSDRSVHERSLLASYEKASGGDWTQVPADGYIHRNLVRHLLDGDRPAVVRDLLDRTTDDGRNAWYESQIAADGVLSYLADLDRVLHVERDEARVLHLQLMRTSARSGPARVPREVRVALLRAGATGPGVALAATAAIADPRRRVTETLAAVAALDEDDPQRESALAECLATVRDRGVQVVAELLPRIALLSPPGQRPTLAAEALDAARRIGVDNYRASALAGIAPLLDGEARERVVTEAAEALRAGVMSASFPEAAHAVLPLRPQVAPALLRAASTISEPFVAALAYEAVVPHLPVEEREEAAREGIRRFEESRANGLWIVISLACHVPDLDLDALVDQAATRDPRQMAALLDRLDDLSADAGWKAAVVTRVTAAAESLEEPSRTMTRIATLARRPPADRASLVTDIVNDVERLRFDTWRREAVTALAPHLDLEGLRRAARFSATLDDAADVLAAAARLARHADASLVDRIGTAIEPLPASRQKLAGLIALAEATTDPARRTALTSAACALVDKLGPGAGAAEVARLCAMLDTTSRERILTTALHTTFALGNPKAFLNLVPLLPADQVIRGYEMMLADAERRSQHRQTTWSDGPVVAQNTTAVVFALEDLAPTLPAPLLHDAATVVNRMEARHWRFVARHHLVPNLDAATRAVWVALLLGPEGESELATGLQADDRPGRFASASCRALARTATVLDGPELARCRQLIAALITRVEPDWLPTVFQAVAPQLDAAFLEAQIERALAHNDPYSALAAARVTAPPRRHELLLRALSRGLALEEIVAALGDAPQSVRDEAWTVLRSAPPRAERKDVASRLAAAAPLAAEGLPAALADSLLRVVTWWP
jgi:hypothetical protein